MSNNDWFAPAFEVEVDGSRLAAEVEKHITEVTVTSQPNTIDMFELMLVNPFPDLPWTHDAKKSKLFQEGNSIGIRLGYVDAVKLLFDGEITSLTPSFPETGVATVRVTGLSRLHWLDKDLVIDTYRDMTDKEIVEKIANRVKLTPKAEATPTKHPHVVQNEKDLTFLRKRAEALHFELLTEGKDLIFRKAKEGEAKTYTLVWGNPQEGVKPGGNTMPLRSFSPTVDPRRQPSAVVLRSLHPDTRELIEERASAGDVAAAMGGAKTGPQVAAQAFGAGSERVIVNRPVASAAEAREIVHAELNRDARRLVTGRGTSIGITDLRAGRVVELKGIGRFSGAYYVTSATHTVSATGYETTFEVERSSIG